jgi:hypothetical protein
MVPAHELCRSICNKLGKEDSYYTTSANVGCYMRTDKAKTYKDAVIVITCDENSKAMVVLRLENNNPVLWIKNDGSVGRTHGEFNYIMAHIEKLSLQLIG